MLPSLRLAIATLGIALTVLSGCSTTSSTQAASRCHWPNPMYQDCREFIEFNTWR
jgi:hypothetical protein